MKVAVNVDEDEMRARAVRVTENGPLEVEYPNDERLDSDGLDERLREYPQGAASIVVAEGTLQGVGTALRGAVDRVEVQVTGSRIVGGE